MQADASPPHRSSQFAAVVSVLCGLLAAALVLWSTASFGAGVDSDSAQYLSAAESASRGAGWLAIDGTPYTLWPPLFPTILAACKAVGGSAVGAARWLGALSACAVVCGGAFAAGRIARSRLAQVLCAVALASSAPLIANCAMVLSEPVFLALSTATCVAWIGYTESRTSARFAALIALSAATLLQRYLGVTLVASIALLLALEDTDESPLRRLRRSASYVACSALPLLAWFLRNRAVAGELDGKRGPAVGHFAADAHNAWTWSTKWFALALENPWLAGALMAIPLALFASAAWSAFAREPRARVFVVFPILYVAGLIALRQVVEFDELDERLLAPFVPAMWVALTLGADAWLARSRGVPRAVSAAVIGVWLLGHLAFAVGELRERAEFWRADGIALYEKPHWQHSPTIEWLRSQPEGGAWMSNDPFAVFCTTGRRSTMLPLRKAGFARLRDRLAAEPAERRIAWFTFNERAVFPAEALAPALRVERVQRFEDGEIYVVR
jgi:hypothetical protein